MKTAFIGIGSNMSDPHRNCLDAVDRIGRIDNCEIISESSLYLTAPVGVQDQEWYINSAVSITTGLSAQDLMKRLLEIEADMGRVRTTKWGPRVIDLDILLFGQDIIDDILVKVPHPMMHLRKFVMAPMAELAPDLIHPGLGKTIMELLKEIPDDGQIVKRL
jgi:2-amino-4-hydroxy-6-hydroxymethyldihydropteridine diphosphokinase